jgi:DNA polymerase/3'-5' exonuclease PolX
MKQKVPLQEAKEQADRLAAMLRPYCDRVEIAGSIRRQKPEVGDIEIVCVPTLGWKKDLLGQDYPAYSLLDIPIGQLEREGYRVNRNGPRFKQVVLANDLCLDLFIVTPPAQWGYIYAIRTGPAEFSKWVVTRRNKGGALPSYLRVEGGAVWHGTRCIPTPEEDDFLGLCGLAGLAPQERMPGVALAR